MTVDTVSYRTGFLIRIAHDGGLIHIDKVEAIYLFNRLLDELVTNPNTFVTRELTPVKGRAADPAQMTGITGKHDREETKAPTAGARPVPDL